MSKENVYLDPIYKWTGGKRKEIKTYSKFYPDIVSSGEFKLVEPFFGGGATYWSMNAPQNAINDVDPELVNFLRVAKTDPEAIRQAVAKDGAEITRITALEKSKSISISEAKTQRGVRYYELRNQDRNGGLANLTDTDRAIRFYIVNQLAFNGMRRFNSRGEFNVPYGNYKSLNIKLTDQHVELLQRTEITQGDYSAVMAANDREDCFIYLDPPYTREFTEYSHDCQFGPNEQRQLAETFKSLKSAKAMMIINKDEFTTGLYQDYIKHTYDLRYSTNIKNRYDNSVQHLVITNY